MSATTVQLLQAAAEIVGSNRALAERLGINENLLGRFLRDARELPDALLLRAVDIILADRQARIGESRSRKEVLPTPSGIPDNCGRGSGPGSELGTGG